MRKISTLTGIIIIFAVAVILFGGVFAYQYSVIKRIQQINIVQPIDQTAGSPVQSQQATEGWKTYTNTQYGFELEYPSDWKTSSPSANKLSIFCDLACNQATGVCNRCKGLESVMLGDVSYEVDVEARNNLSLEDFIKEYNSSDQFGTKIIDQQVYAINSINSLKLIGTTAYGANRNIIFITKDGKSFIIYLGEGVDLLPVYQQMLSTFRFTK